jgi:hypothetical protein
MLRIIECGCQAAWDGSVVLAHASGWEGQAWAAVEAALRSAAGSAVDYLAPMVGQASEHAKCECDHECGKFDKKRH